MAGSSFALDSFDRNDLALDLLDTDGLFGEQEYFLQFPVGYLRRISCSCDRTVCY